MYQIALRFRNAKRFINQERIGKTKLDHTIYEFGGAVRSATVEDRTDCPADTLPLHCVANAIAVLCGDRPIPTKRSHSAFADYEEFSHYVDMARRAKVMVTTHKDNGSTMQTAKASMYNLDTDKGVSCKKKKTSAELTIDGKDYELRRGCPTHHGISYAWPREIYLKFDSMCKSDIGPDYAEYMNVLQTLSLLREEYKLGKREVIDFFSELGKAKPVTVVERDLVDPVVRGVVSGQIFRGENWANGAELKGWVAPVSSHGTPERSWVISGLIFLQVTKEEAEAIIRGPEVATILDGGVLEPVAIMKNGEPTDQFESLRECVPNWNTDNNKLPAPFEA